MRKVLGCVACLVTIALAVQLVGCGGKTKTEEKTGGAGGETKATSAKKLVGTWTGKPEIPPGEQPPPGMDITMTLTFKDEHKMSVTMAGQTLDGTWKVLSEDGDKLSIDTEVEVPAGPPGKSGEKPKTKKDATKFAVEFKNADRIAMTPQGKDGNEPMTFDRKK